MILDYETLKLVWWVLVGVLLIGFAITDGMDMGVGTLLPLLGKNDTERRVIINTIGPHWDGNQVWLITAGGAIFAAWPAVYAAAFSGFYIAMLLVLFALFWRPVGFDYRSKLPNPRWRNAWDWGLFAGGFVPSLVFGVAFGNLLQGVPFHLDSFLRPTYDGSFWGLILNPFALLAGVLSLLMLTLQGALWLQLRADQVIAARARYAALLLGLSAALVFVLAGIWTDAAGYGYQITHMPATDALPNPLAKEVIASGSWLDNYDRFSNMWIAPFVGIVGFLMAGLMAWWHRPGLGFVMNSLAIAGVIFTAGLSMFPFIMPSSSSPSSSFTVWDATSSHLTLTVMFWATVIFLPLVLSYTVWTFRKMWGRVTVEFIRENDVQAY